MKRSRPIDCQHGMLSINHLNILKGALVRHSAMLTNMTKQLEHGQIHEITVLQQCKQKKKKKTKY